MYLMLRSNLGLKKNSIKVWPLDGVSAVYTQIITLFHWNTVKGLKSRFFEEKIKFWYKNNVTINLK